jgi:hypothetical protein
MHMIWVNGYAYDLSVDFFEIFDSVRETDDLGGTDVGEVEGIEEQNHTFTFVVVETDGFDGEVRHHGFWGELDGFVTGHDGSGEGDEGDEDE